jgi:hypothetical protein
MRQTVRRKDAFHRNGLPDFCILCPVLKLIQNIPILCRLRLAAQFVVPSTRFRVLEFWETTIYPLFFPNDLAYCINLFQLQGWVDG